MYLRVKVLTSYAMALVSIVALYLSGTALGVRLSADTWLKMTVLILVGLIPFAALGIALGHVLTPDSIGPATGGTISLLALLGGSGSRSPGTGSCTTSRSTSRPTGWCRPATSRWAGRPGAPAAGS